MDAHEEDDPSTSSTIFFHMSEGLMHDCTVDEHYFLRHVHIITRVIMSVLVNCAGWRLS
jgi:hypothetical protein